LVADVDEKPISIAAYPPENIIEEGYVRQHGDYYYLWESVDRCCRGIDSTYRILVGRSKDVRGPYLDRDGTPMLRGGGTLVLASYDNVRGPGSCAIIHIGDRDFLIHHEYDGENRGMPTLQIRQLFWAEDDWPVAGEPITRSPAVKSPTAKPMIGDWLVRTNFGDSRRMTLEEDGTISPTSGTWRLDGNVLTMQYHKAAKDLVEQHHVSEDGSFFVGRNRDGEVVSGVRVIEPGTNAER
jgi:hypothetical protein